MIKRGMRKNGLVYSMKKKKSMQVDRLRVTRWGAAEGFAKKRVAVVYELN